MIKRALLFLKPSYNPNLSKDKSSTSSSCSSTTGYLYIVLPLPCINNSRYLDHDRFTAMLQHLECHLLQHHFSKKLAFYLFQYQPFDSSATRARLMSEINQEEEQPLPSTTRMAAFPKKQIDPDYLRPAMNNFSIVI